MYTAFPCSDYYGPSAPSRHHQPTVDLPADQLAAGREGQPGTVPTFTMYRSTGSAPSSAPAASPTATPQTFTVASPPTSMVSFGVVSPCEGSTRTAARPASTRLEPVPHLRGINRWFNRYACLSRLPGIGPSGSAGPPRRCQGCFPPFPAPPGSGCPQLHRPAATGRRGGSLTRPRLHGASWRTRTI